MRLAAALCFLALASSACSTPLYREPTNEEKAAADYGAPPTNYAERLKAFLLHRYQGRAVAAVHLGSVRKVWYGELGRLTKDRDVRFGWGVPFRGYRLGFASLEAFVVQGTVFFSDGVAEAIQDDEKLEFLGR